jgi:competence protein ComGF
LTPIVTELLTISLPARPIIALLALIYPDATHHVFHATGESERIHLLKTLHHYDEPWGFHESTLHESIRRWMTVWIESLDRYIVLEGTSIMMQKKFSLLIEEKELIILQSITEFVLFFFQSRNIIISRSTTGSYAQFILKNIRQTLQKSIDTHPDADMIRQVPVTEMDLFGL